MQLHQPAVPESRVRALIGVGRCPEMCLFRSD